jgi:hypothetical protein
LAPQRRPRRPDIAAQAHRYKTLTLQGTATSSLCWLPTVAGATGSSPSGPDILFGLLSHELYRLLVIVQGWAPEHWERWTAETLAEQLLPAS